MAISSECSKQTPVTAVSTCSAGVGPTLQDCRVGAWEWDLGGGRLYWSPTLECIFGFSPGAFGGKMEDLLGRVHQADQSIVRAATQAAIQNAGSFRCEHRIQHEGGMMSWVEFRGWMLPEAQGGPHMAGVCVELARLRKIEEEGIPEPGRLPQTTEKQGGVERKSTEKQGSMKRLAWLDRLSAEVAHEINNPLNVILLTAETALRFPGEDDVELAFKLIRDEARRAGQITKNLLGFARATPATKTLEDLNEVVEHAIVLACRYIHSDRLVCAMELAESLPRVSINVTEIEQVLVNLIKNAAEASGGLVHVVVRTAMATDGLRISVADDGPGIQAELLDKLFTPFFSTKRDTGGTGLGLSVSCRIIADHGGQITVESAPGQGTVFTVRLNAAEACPAQLSRERPLPKLSMQMNGQER